jgi:hypothetical protein
MPTPLVKLHQTLVCNAEVFCTFQFEGIHNWPDCPIEEVKYLRDPHRHMFHVKAYKVVSHDDRDTEFIWLKHRMQEFIRANYPNDEAGVAELGAYSCEMIARDLIGEFGLSKCEVSEDGENGSILYRAN